MNYQDAIEWLYGTQLFGIKLGLDPVARLLRELDIDPERTGIPVVHVAGTNGKGSVCAFTEQILRDGGLRTGLFTSPHLVSYRERIRVNGEEIPEEDLAALLQRIRTLVADWDPHPTFFEISLAAAMRHFLDTACEVVVLETGMGGRYDATNAVQASVAVITSVALDHEQWLGNSIREIAVEKAGIIKRDTPVVIGELHPEARDVVGRRALEVGVPCIEAHPLPPEWNLGLRGPHQRGNASLAVEAACRVAGDQLTREGIVASLEKTRWPGRFQIWEDKVVLDGAHNPEAAGVLADTWRECFGEAKAELVFSAVESKDVAGVLEHLLPLAGSVTLVPVNSSRALSLDRLQEALVVAAGGREIPVTRAESVADALKHPAGDSLRLVAGSLFLVGEALGVLQGGVFESSVQ